MEIQQTSDIKKKRLKIEKERTVEILRNHYLFEVEQQVTENYQ